MRYLLCACLLLSSCTSYLFNRSEETRVEGSLDEMRLEIADLKHALTSAQISLQLVEERVQTQEFSVSALKQQSGGKTVKSDELSGQLSALERRILQIEKIQEKALSDLKNLGQHASQTASALPQYRDKIYECERLLGIQQRRLDEVGNLKTTLSSISKAMAVSSGKRHKVQTGETLEKIARQYHVTVADLKNRNRLQTDRISAGQELEIPNNE